MNFFQLSYYRNYLYSPKTSLHNIEAKIKIIILFCQLIFLPYISIKYMTIFVLLLLLCILNLNLNKSIKNNIYSILILFFYLLY
uniref:Uncharacterized protein n=1 Tax=Sporolithon durum TaxID=48970 RepID=A0A141SCU7_9FLOR|nr:hypothetical protein Sdur_056 [Sporolithon durum]AMK96115.1 hypothetical protein Sdur_056 [Sporolithon durum]